MHIRRMPKTIAGIILLTLTIATVALLAQAQSADGAATFKAKCAMCHGPDGAGKTPMGAKLNIPSLAAPEAQKKSDAALTEIIGKGKNKMPEFGSKLSAAQIAQLKDFIRGLAKK